MFSWEYCEIFKNIYFEEHLRKAAADVNTIYGNMLIKFDFSLFRAEYTEASKQVPVQSQ